MINTRKTIFETLKKRIRELTKHAQLAPLEFKKIMLAVILNDLKEWSEYIPKDDPDAITKLLENYLLNNCFIINRMPNEDSLAYVNVNTPQTNNTWRRIWDIEKSKFASPEKQECSSCSWTPDDNCEIKMVYFYTPENQTPKAYLELTYGQHGEKLKTVCDKMNIFIDRSTGLGWYLDTDCTWKRIGAGLDGMTKEEVEELISEYRIHNQWISDGREIELTLSKDPNADNTLDVITADDVEEMI